MSVQLKYFAWVRERIGLDEETLDLPDTVTDVPALLDHLAARGEGHARALADRAVIRVALDKRLVDADAPLAGAREIALFPPMTGG